MFLLFNPKLALEAMTVEGNMWVVCPFLLNYKFQVNVWITVNISHMGESGWLPYDAKYNVRIEFSQAGT